MNERGVEKFVKRITFGKPDYRKYADAGAPLGVVYFVKSVRDSLGSFPNKVQAQRQYPGKAVLSDRKNILIRSGR